ncbi:hybrid sensor histidine kinase/response regulator [Steroidobacter agaridevorans]|uniref:histidine kinase n=1 Tax=Steroidobacter agaridevorans TaxID=2695856 RepID=A0A829YK78_9GAMM|nr:response regulator [Steroidobacter agaridevorans]GFE83757.1 hybrid sensor histidine kinase/response regulator [Steroidobacter agaridevorans]GFE91655.1 hybrid sensor histidine kinase/response regulator [Steroidobacter agaridevorans]
MSKAGHKSVHRSNILLVDDERANLDALEAVLEGLGQNLITASRGEQALKCVLEYDFAVILLDVQMPGMSGIETAALIRARERSRATPIIFLTGMMRTAEMVFSGYSAGAVDYLMKPLEPEVLRAKVAVFVELDKARHELEQEIGERVRIAEQVTELNNALREKNDDLSAANADLESFCHSVSHDLRMPLRHIHSYVSMLEVSAGAKLNPEERRHVHTVQKAAMRMTRLIDDLLAFSRIGRAAMHRQRIRMDELIDETFQELGPELSDRHIDWERHAIPDTVGDPQLMKQVWINLLANAVKYTRPRDPAKIEIGADVSGNEVVYYVRDNGVGFNMQYADRLFGVFQRLHAETDFEGTGVGLANVRRIVQRHGGRTWAEGAEGRGATVYFSMPIAGNA